MAAPHSGWAARRKTGTLFEMNYNGNSNVIPNEWKNNFTFRFFLFYLSVLQIETTIFSILKLRDKITLKVRRHFMSCWIGHFSQNLFSIPACLTDDLLVRDKAVRETKCVGCDSWFPFFLNPPPSEMLHLFAESGRPPDLCDEGHLTSAYRKWANLKIDFRGQHGKRYWISTSSCNRKLSTTGEIRLSKIISHPLGQNNFRKRLLVEKRIHLFECRHFILGNGSISLNESRTVAQPRGGPPELKQLL